MAEYEEIALGTVLADPVAVFERVEKEGATPTVLRGGDSVAAIFPTPGVERIVDVQQALHQEWPDSAYAIRQDDVVGSLTPGRFADLVVLTDNLLAVPPDALSRVEVLMTMIGGVTEFCAPDAEAVCRGVASSHESGPAAAWSNAPGQGPALASVGQSQDSGCSSPSRRPTEPCTSYRSMVLMWQHSMARPLTGKSS